MGRATGCSSTSATRCTPTTCSPSPAGSRCRRPTGPRLPVIVGEKGTYWSKHHACTARPATASQPFRTDNALVTAAEVVRRLAEYRPADADPRHVAPLRRGHRTSTRSWRRCCSTPTASTTLSPSCRSGWPGIAHACTHTTFAPTITHGGTKTNVIPDRVDLEVDIRTLPGQTRRRRRRAMLDDALGDLADAVEIDVERRPRRPRRRSTRRCGTRWHASPARLCEGSALVPFAHGRRAPTTASSAAPARSATASGCSAASGSLRGLRHDVPRQRRARRPGVARALDPALGSRRPRPPAARGSSARERLAAPLGELAVEAAPRPAHTRKSIADEHRGGHAEVERAAVDPAGGGDRADHVDGEERPRRGG